MAKYVWRLRLKTKGFGVLTVGTFSSRKAALFEMGELLGNGEEYVIHKEEVSCERYYSLFPSRKPKPNPFAKLNRELTRKLGPVAEKFMRDEEQSESLCDERSA